MTVENEDNIRWCFMRSHSCFTSWECYEHTHGFSERMGYSFANVANEMIGIKSRDELIQGIWVNGSNSKASGRKFTRCSRLSRPFVRDRTHTWVPSTRVTRNGPTLETPRWVRGCREIATNWPVVIGGCDFLVSPYVTGWRSYCCLICSSALMRFSRTYSSTAFRI